MAFPTLASLNDSFPPILLNTESKFNSTIEAISSMSSFALDFEGRDLGRTGVISLAQIAIESLSQVFLHDMIAISPNSLSLF
jgi:hypothetical protein